MTGQDESPHSTAAQRVVRARSLKLESHREDHLENDSEKQDARFLRTDKRIPVRRGPLATKAGGRLKAACKLLELAGILTSLAALAYGYGKQSPRFLINSSDHIEIAGVRNASRDEVMHIVGDVIGRNLFFVSLDDRRAQLERIPWIESARVMRLLPDRIVVDITERMPVAFVQIGNRINLIDAGGVLLGPPASRETRFSFPVIHGITETEPLSTRAALMKVYNRLIRELGPANTRQVSEADLSDPEDVKAVVDDAGGTVLIHLGASDFLERYNLYAAHIGEWRRQFQKVQSVDLRYEGQIVVNPDGVEKSEDRESVRKSDRGHRQARRSRKRRK